MKFRAKAAVLGGIVLAASGLMAGCSQPASVVTNPPATAEEVARQVLEEVYSCGAQDSSDFAEALAQRSTSESALDQYLANKVGDSVSDEGLADLLDNQVINRVLSVWPASEVKVDQISLADLRTESDGRQVYSYTVAAAPEGEDLETFTGEVGLTQTDGFWQITSIH